jgi:cell shape-determining protein MreD
MNKFTNMIKNVPSFVLALLILFESSHKSLLSFGNDTPFYDFIVLFYFCFFIPESFPYLLLIILGALKSYLTMSPISLFIASFVFLKFLIEKEKILIKDKSFSTILMLVILNFLLFSLVQLLLIMSYSETNFLELTKLYLRRGIITLLVYVPVHFILSNIIMNKPPIENE